MGATPANTNLKFAVPTLHIGLKLVVRLLSRRTIKIKTDSSGEGRP
jgi:hypothetical protein